VNGMNRKIMESCKLENKLTKAEKGTPRLIPFIGVKVPAGFPSPADDYVEGKVDLNNIVIKNQDSTFYMKVEGDSMIKANINDGDVLVVDKSIEPVHGKIVIAILDGEFTVKTLYNKDGVIKLVPANENYEEIILGEYQELNVWGVVTFVLHKI